MTARSKYIQFHQHEPRKVGSFASSLVIPDQALWIGDAISVLYRSDKLNPETGQDEGWIDYIHGDPKGRGAERMTARVYRCDRRGRGSSSDDAGELATVPAWLRGAKELTWLGDCLGFSYTDLDGKKREAKGSGVLPELYTTPSGKALLVIQSKRSLLAMFWGGRLGVEPRGIVY
jgi:hypothetical protein